MGRFYLVSRDLAPLHCPLSNSAFYIFKHSLSSAFPQSTELINLKDFSGVSRVEPGTSSRWPERIPGCRGRCVRPRWSCCRTGRSSFASAVANSFGTRRYYDDVTRMWHQLTISSVVKEALSKLKLWNLKLIFVAFDRLGYWSQLQREVNERALVKNSFIKL